MGGERFEVNDPNYLFGDNCDLNFLACTKPYSIPYKKAQQSLLSNLNMKQKAINKVSSRMGSLSSPLNILTGRHRQISQSHKQDAQTQTLNSTKGISSGPEPSQPLVMLVHIRKETLRLIKTSNIHNLDSDQNSLTNTASVSNVTPVKKGIDDSTTGVGDKNQSELSMGTHTANAIKTKQTPEDQSQDCVDGDGTIKMNATAHYSKIQRDSDSPSLASVSSLSDRSTITSKSGYTSVRDVPPSDCASDENDECYQDALNEPTNLSGSLKGVGDDVELDGVHQIHPHDQVEGSTKLGDSVSITMDQGVNHRDDEPKQFSDMNRFKAADKHHCDNSKITSRTDSKKPSFSNTEAKQRSINVKELPKETQNRTSDQVYNIEFMFDSEVDCSIRIFYFCTRDVTSNNVSYKPQHATYKSKTYTYRKGLNQKFEQPEHTFQPYLFDEDLLIHKPLDLDGNYNSGAVFPIVIHCAALEGPSPKQSQSLVATVEKSQLDDSYSIKPLKQLLFVDGVQYILQDIYGIENKHLLSSHNQKRSSARARLNRNFRSSFSSLYSTSNLGSNLNLSDTASIGSVVDGSLTSNQNGRNSPGPNQYRSLVSENSFECVICMSDERDTMLLPCRHLCLCSTCAQSLRYQASSCPICRCPFKAALNIRIIRKDQYVPRSWSNSEVSNESQAAETAAKVQAGPEAVTSSATPLLSQIKSGLVGGRKSNGIIPRHSMNTNSDDRSLFAGQNNPETSGTSNDVRESSSLEMRTMNNEKRGYVKQAELKSDRRGAGANR
jgi:hypothetical protein